MRMCAASPLRGCQSAGFQSTTQNILLAEKHTALPLTHQGRSISFTNAFAFSWKNLSGRKGSWISPGVTASPCSALYGWGGFIGDQQEADKIVCQAGTCHRCHTSLRDFLETKRFARQRTSVETKKAVLDAAAGAHSRGKPVVDWDANDRRLAAGSGVKGYDRVRKLAGAHLVQNAFWLAQDFCACQMLMYDPNHGVIIYLLRAILCGTMLNLWRQNCRCPSRQRLRNWQGSTWYWASARVREGKR
jgi:hypothetical protein